MSSDDDFEKIIGGMGESPEGEEDTGEDFEHDMDVVAHYWKDFHPGSIFVKGILIVECATPDGRSLHYQTSTPISEWEILGMMECVRQQVNAQNVLEVLTTPEGMDEDDDDE